MASNSEANLPSDFDIDEVINCWGEHSSSKDIGFELEQLGLPNEAKTSQNTTTNHATLSSVVSTQQNQIPATKSSGQTLFASQNNATTIPSKIRHGSFPSSRTMVGLPAPSFPSESLDIPSINLTQSQPAAMMPFQPGLVRNATLNNPIQTQQMSTFSRMEEDDSFVEGPLDKIVDQIMDREYSQAIMKTSTISNTFPKDHVTHTGTILSPVPSTLGTVTVNLSNSAITQSYQPKSAAETQFNIQSFASNMNFTRPSSVNLHQQQTQQLSNMRQKSTISVQKAAINIEEILKSPQPIMSPKHSSFENQLQNKSTSMLTSPPSVNNVDVVKTSNINYTQSSVVSPKLTMNAGNSALKGPIPNSLPKSSFVSTFNTIQSPTNSTFTTQLAGKVDNLGKMTTKSEPRPMLVSLGADKRFNVQSTAGGMQAVAKSPNLLQSSPKTMQSFSIFNTSTGSVITSVPPKTQMQQVKQVTTQPGKTFVSSANRAPAQVNVSTPTGTNLLRISSPGNVLSSFQPSKQQPNTTTQTRPTFLFPSNINPQSISSTTGLQFPTFQLSQSKILGNLSNTSKSTPMVFALAPGSQGAASLKALPLIAKDKLTGRQIFLIKQPGQQVITKPSTPQMNIVFINEGSIPHVVCGQPKAMKIQPSSVAPSTPMTSTTQVSTNLTPTSITSQPMVKMGIQDTTPMSGDIDKAVSPITIDDSSRGSPASVHSSDSQDSFSALRLPDDDMTKMNEEPSRKKRGIKRRKDPNRPVKPLSSFQRFFQKTQVEIRQKSPSITFAEVSKIAKQLWENISAKEKKVYQDAWRSERAQYKKAMMAYEASFEDDNEIDGSPSKQTRNGPSLMTSVSPGESPKHLSPSTTPIPTSPMMTTLTIAGGTIASHGGGKPLAMMLANKTKMTSPPGKTVPTAKISLPKIKPTNGVDDELSIIPKKKQKINPIPKKPCIREDCNRFSRATKDRGNLFCSNECVLLHSRNKFSSWVTARRATLKAGS